MKILSHRGLWYKKEERNTEAALAGSLDNNFGLETDIRDWKGDLVICHDIPNGNMTYSLSDFFSMYKDQKKDLLLALNIKADGLQSLLLRALKEYGITNYFVFDMSIPDTLAYLDQGFNVYLRQSEYEQDTILYNKAQGIWLDAFTKIWYDEQVIKNHLSSNKHVCLVSEELHKRPFQAQWKLIKEWSLNEHSNFSLCTDHPELAQKFFSHE